MRNPIDVIVGDLGDKKKWREYKARIRQLPAPYREAANGLERYAMTTGVVTDGARLVRMLEDLADHLERGAADGTPIRDLVGGDPADFMESFLDAYREDGRSWADRERNRLAETIDRAVEKQDRSAES